jgi:hypothetical protein
MAHASSIARFAQIKYTPSKGRGAPHIAVHEYMSFEAFVYVDTWQLCDDYYWELWISDCNLTSYFLSLTECICVLSHENQNKVTLQAWTHTRAVTRSNWLKLWCVKPGEQILIANVPSSGSIHLQQDTKKKVQNATSLQWCYEHPFNENCAYYFLCSVHICEILYVLFLSHGLHNELTHMIFKRSIWRHGLLKGILGRSCAEK